VAVVSENCGSARLDLLERRFVVTVNGIASNPFTILRQYGHIYFVSANGSDGNNGSSTTPWKTIPHAVQTAGTSAGNIVYVNGISQTTDDGQGWRAALTLRNEWCRGTASQPNALVAYPMRVPLSAPQPVRILAFGVQAPPGEVVRVRVLGPLQNCNCVVAPPLS